MDRYYRTERDRDRLTEKTHRWMDRDYRTERERERERESQSVRKTDGQRQRWVYR